MKLPYSSWCIIATHSWHTVLLLQCNYNFSNTNELWNKTSFSKWNVCLYFATVHNKIATVTAINPAITNGWTSNDSCYTLVTICIKSNIIMIIIAKLDKSPVNHNVHHMCKGWFYMSFIMQNNFEKPLCNSLNIFYAT